MCACNQKQMFPAVIIPNDSFVVITRVLVCSSLFFNELHPCSNLFLFVTLMGIPDGYTKINNKGRSFVNVWWEASEDFAKQLFSLETVPMNSSFLETRARSEFESACRRPGQVTRACRIFDILHIFSCFEIFRNISRFFEWFFLLSPRDFLKCFEIFLRFFEIFWDFLSC